MASMTQLSMTQFTQPVDSFDDSSSLAPSIQSDSTIQSDTDVTFDERVELIPSSSSNNGHMKIDFFVPNKKVENEKSQVQSGPAQLVNVNNFIEDDVPEPKAKVITQAMEDAKQFIIFEAAVGSANERYESNNSPTAHGSVHLSDDSDDESFNQAVDLAIQTIPVKTIYDDDQEEIVPRSSQEGNVTISFEDIEREYNKDGNKTETYNGRNFFAKMDDTNRAEEELNRRFKKDDFDRLNVIGQFNKGFIVAILDNDLFLIDQHACDEKFNFEKVI